MSQPNVETDEAGMAAAGSECQARAGEFTGLMQNVNTEMATLQGTWTGTASTTFNTAMDTWERSFSKVIEELIVMAEKLNVNMQGYANAEDIASGSAGTFASSLPGV